MNLVKRMPIQSILGKVPKFKLPERLRGGMIENATNYIRNVYLDYRSVFLDTCQDARDRPLRAGIIGSSLLGLLYLGKHNPSEENFVEQMIEYNNNISRVPESILNKRSSRHIDEVFTLFDQKLLRHQSLGIFSVIYRVDHAPDTDLFMAQCKYIRPTWKSYLTERIVDVGILDIYQWMRYNMIDYDVNTNEWDDQIAVNENQ